MKDDLARKNALIAREKELRANYREQIQNLNGQLRAAGWHADIIQSRGSAEVDRYAKELAVKMETPKQTIDQAQRVLGVRIVMREP